MLKTLLLAGALLAAGHAGATAQDWPAGKPVTLIVPFSAGGPADTIARLITRVMGAELGTSFVIENAVGAGGTIGMNRVAKAAPDGYTLLLMHTGHATAPSFYAKLPFEPVKDFQPIGMVTDVPMTIVGRKDYPAANLQELVADLKAKGDKVNYANVGLGSASHLCGLLLMSAIDRQLTWVPYKGGAPALNDLLAGHVDIYCEPATGTTPHIQSGQIKGYAVTTKTRVTSLPDLPTADEAGLPGFSVSTWYGLHAPAATPRPIVDKLAKALRTALSDPTVKARFAELSMEPVAAGKATPEAMEAFLVAELARWTQLLKKAGVKPE